MGGLILTGNVDAYAEVTNVVNSTETNIGCDCEGRDDVTVTTNNSARVKNYVDVSGNTGGNTANGDDGGDGGDGGNRRYSRHHHGSGGGTGGNGGAGGDGGEIGTGDVLAGASVANYINSTVTSL